MTQRERMLLVAAVLLAAAPTPARAEQARTSKERLTSKAADRQRVDDCKVPPELRGDSRRPTECGHGVGGESRSPTSGGDARDH